MLVSAEIRWFWRSADVPVDLAEWFHPAGSKGFDPKPRRDDYFFMPDQTELGIKRRNVSESNRTVEIKGLVGVTRDLLVSPFEGRGELWTKWPTDAIEMAGEMITTEKQRWLRKFATDESGDSAPKEIPLGDDELPLDKDVGLPAFGCNVELTQVRLLPAAELWWTLGFEAFGTIHTVEMSLRAVAVELAKTRPPSFGGALNASYPAWLKKHGKPL